MLGSCFTCRVAEVVGFERLKELQMLAQGTLRSKIDYGDHVWKVATHWTNEIQNVTVHKFTLQQMPGPPKQDQTWYTWLHGTDHSGVSVFLLRQGELYLQTSRWPPFLQKEIPSLSTEESVTNLAGRKEYDNLSVNCIIPQRITNSCGILAAAT